MPDLSTAVFIRKETAQLVSDRVLSKRRDAIGTFVSRHIRRGEMQGWKVMLRFEGDVTEPLSNDAFEQIAGAAA